MAVGITGAGNQNLEGCLQNEIPLLTVNINILNTSSGAKLFKYFKNGHKYGLTIIF